MIGHCGTVKGQWDMAVDDTEVLTLIGGTYCNKPNKERLLLKEEFFLPPVYIILPYIHNIWLDKVLSGIRGKREKAR